jgi:predicted outer membrane protein
VPSARRAQSQAGSEQEQKAALEEALQAAGGNVSIAAAKLGLARSYMTKLVKKYGLREIAAQLRRERGARELQSGPRAGTVGLGRPSKKAPPKSHIR